MSEKKSIRRTFWIHQYEEEEKYLSEMHAKGWKLESLSAGIPTKYTFTRCEPESFLYQLDFISEEEDTESYHQLFLDAGWAEILQWQGMGGKWYYFCKKNASESDRIYTDINSKFDLFQKLWRRYFFYFLGSLFLLLNGIRICVDWVQREERFLVFLGGILCVFFCAAAVVLLYMSIALLKKKIQLYKRKNDVL